MESLATYYKPQFNIDITLLEPGAIATNFVPSAISHIQNTGGFLDDEYKPILQAYLDTFAKRNSVPQTAESVADVMMELVNMEAKPLRLRISESADKFTAFKTSDDPTGLKGIQNTRSLQLGL
ncbi:hypothetical protein M3194_09390 [Paenibacillus glycanilyticus]|nr:hypothetical protein [Paenibacillus glycanilyticus]